MGFSSMFHFNFIPWGNRHPLFKKHLNLKHFCYGNVMGHTVTFQNGFHQRKLRLGGCSSRDRISHDTRRHAICLPKNYFLPRKHCRQQKPADSKSRPILDVLKSQFFSYSKRQNSHVLEKYLKMKKGFKW